MENGILYIKIMKFQAIERKEGECIKQRKRYSGWFVLVLVLAASVLLSGCSVIGLDAQALMHPPKPTGEKAGMYALLKSKAGKNFTLKYPTAGENRSAIIQHNLCGDSHKETVALYQRKGDDTAVSILFTALQNGKWKDIGSFTHPAAQVDRICFGDLNGDGQDETIVGWGNSAGSASLISVFYYKNGKMNELKLDQTYNELAVMDFDGDGKKELLTASIPADSEQQFVASLFRLKGDALQLMGSIRMDTGLSKFADLLSGNVSKGQLGVLLDCVQTNGRELTELIYWNRSKKMLCAPLYNAQSPQQNVTLRDMSIASGDVNNDGNLEFPIVTRLPGYTGASSDDVGNEVQWTRFDAASGNYTLVSSMLINTRDGYRLLLPDKWKDTITTKQNVSARRLTIYVFNSAKGTMESPLMNVQIFTKKEWDSSKNKNGYKQVAADENSITAVNFPSPNHKLAVPFATIQRCFQPIAKDS